MTSPYFYVMKTAYLGFAARVTL